MLKKLAWLLLPAFLLSLPGCALCIGGAVGTVVGYEAHERGYKVRSPVYKGGGSGTKPSEKY